MAGKAVASPLFAVMSRTYAQPLLVPRSCTNVYRILPSNNCEMRETLANAKYDNELCYVIVNGCYALTICLKTQSRIDFWKRNYNAIKTRYRESLGTSTRSAPWACA